MEKLGPSYQEIKYTKRAKFLSEVMSVSMGTQIPEEYVEKWVTLTQAMRTADDVLDNEPNDFLRNKFIEDSINYLQTGDQMPQLTTEQSESIARLYSIIQTLPDKRKTAFTSTLRDLCNVTELVKTTSLAKEYVFYRRLEGQLIGSLFASIMSDEDRAKPNFSKAVKSIKKFYRAGSLLDSFFDLPTEYDNNEVNLDPSIRNRVALLPKLAVDSVGFIKEVGIKSTPSLVFMATCNASERNNI